MGELSMTFAQPQYLYAIILVLPLLGLFLAWAAQRRQAALRRLGNPALIERLGAQVNRPGRHWQTALWLATVTLLLVALARPQWGAETQEVERKGVQVMVALDVSNSMLAQDVKPSRLERAKLAIADLMRKLGGDEVGLVLFAGASFIQFPLTSDYATAQSFLDDARPNVISKPGTDIGDAVRTALRGFDEHSNSQRVILLITDGEGHDPNSLDVVKQAADEGVIFYTIGFGSPEGVPVPLLDDAGNVVGYKQDAAGETVLTRLDESTLQEIASIGGGQYYRATATGAELDSLLAELNRLQKGEIGTQMETRQIERFQLPLALALIALVASFLIPDRLAPRRRPVANVQPI